MQPALEVPEPIPALPSPERITETHTVIFSGYESDTSRKDEPQEESS